MSPTIIRATVKLKSQLHQGSEINKLHRFTSIRDYSNWLIMACWYFKSTTNIPSHGNRWFLLFMLDFDYLEKEEANDDLFFCGFVNDPNCINTIIATIGYRREGNLLRIVFKPRIANHKLISKTLVRTKPCGRD